MNTSQRLLKRHKRQVAREKNNVTLSEPDLRTPEQIKAAREASRPDSARAGVSAHNAALSFRGGASHSVGGASKTDVSG